MKILALSTAEPGCSLAVTDNDQLVCETYWHSRLTHSRRLLSMAGDLFPDQAGCEISDVDAFVAAKGPGSFTGLRIGISAVLGLSTALSRPAAGVSSLDGIACRFSQVDVPVCAMMDARRGQVYCAVFRFEHGRLKEKTDDTVCSPKQAISMVSGKDAVFAGSGARVYETKIQETFKGRARMAPPFMDAVSAAALAWAARTTPDFFQNPANTLVPDYLRSEGADAPRGFA
ncbi:tRNA (adenosine(37)-N6)-threonylcarbamoyltransferase complex dimerization subunit type 1 TsaB [Desulfotignum phosphitoxidans]|uniref:Putative peptidase M22 glycoprotease n=1 Tax=Desulfotignum phosphitoxidans DSM 13687 TaxID=1286635 RepID=S0G6L7_9BACT|nr:tRNA (adenosine(37)-N6)-threonylcarbamoyltransferase complex dimerization subunit type 1 TsaB [Desulfotignum phosphitoxidans]EMS80447.1 putative peptidase M22 glycoprotease [Desulfotignum phosphitoxidans DSM 13687]